MLKFLKMRFPKPSLKVAQIIQCGVPLWQLISYKCVLQRGRGTLTNEVLDQNDHLVKIKQVPLNLVASFSSGREKKKKKDEFEENPTENTLRKLSRGVDGNSW